MASDRKKAPSPKESPRLYLVTPLAGDAKGDLKHGDAMPVALLAKDLAAAAANADVAAVLLRLAPADERSLINGIKIVAEALQPLGVAVLTEGHAHLVARGGADGAHLSGIEVFTAALSGLKPSRIAGCGGLQTRHDAMVAAEAGADYVLFGEPDRHGVRPAVAAVVERVAWWAEVFEAPCVGYAGAPDEIAPLAAAGADFVALGDVFFAGPGGIAAAAREAMPQLLASAALEPAT